MENNKPIERKAIRAPELAEALGVSRAFAYRLVQKGLIRSVRIGRAVVIPIQAIDDYLSGGR
jgi:excisionase family DNA binding protein